MSQELHPSAGVLANFFRRHLGLENKALTAILGELLMAQEDGHACLNLTPKQRELLVRLDGLHQPKGQAPLVLEEDRLYFRRLWQYEERLALGIRRLLAAPLQEVDEDKLAALADAAGLDPSQRWAVAEAAKRAFAILTGGPGTGKTTTVLQLIALRLWQQPELKIALAAPTGKAAQRLAETLASRIQALPLSQDLKARLPREVTTLHRLLGVRPDTCRVKYDADHPLPYDLIVVDEASMVDLALAAKLVEALPEKAGLVLLGDRYQLASVEAGSVLADLCEGAPAHTFCLTTAHRFRAQLRELAAAVQAGEIAEALDRLPRLEGMAALWRALDEGYRGYWETVHAGGDYRSVHAAFARFRALCAHRRGPLGSDWLNAELEVRWRHRGWIAGGTFYPGRAVLIQENAPDLHLFNGDVGICLEEDEGLRVWFEDGRRLAPMHLPAHQTVFAMTVHKSQGSEFEEVLLVLPIQSSEVLSRELVYTAITRARSQVRCWGPQAVLREALDRRTRRRGGVRFKLTKARL